MNADWNVEKAQYAEFNVPTCGTIAVWKLCRERQPWWKSHDGLNLRCLDQCCCVSFHGTSSSQGWRKMVVQSKFDPWVYILVFAECDLYRFVWESLPTEAYLCWHQCFSVVGQATAKIRPRPAHGLLSNERTWFQELGWGKLSYRSTPLWTSVFFRRWASNSQDSPKASPRATFKWKNLISRTL